MVTSVSGCGIIILPILKPNKQTIEDHQVDRIARSVAVIGIVLRRILSAREVDSLRTQARPIKVHLLALD